MLRGWKFCGYVNGLTKFYIFWIQSRTPARDLWELWMSGTDLDGVVIDVKYIET